jgi:sugar diacid utilization regulator
MAVHVEGGADLAVAAIGGRLAARQEELADRFVDRYSEQIPDYRLADEELLGDVRTTTAHHLALVLSALAEGREIPDDAFESSRESGARRVHQGISLEAFLRAARMWGLLLWQAVLEEADRENPLEHDAVLHIAGEIMRHVDRLSTAVADGYLNELQTAWSDRDTVHRELIDGLVSGQGDSERVRRLARQLKLGLAERYVVIVLRGQDPLAEEQAEQGLAARMALRRTVEAARRHLGFASGGALVGLRRGEVVALCPAESAAAVDDVHTRAGELSHQLEDAGVFVGVGACHPGLPKVLDSYREARDAVEIAVAIGVSGRPLHFEDVVIDHMVRSSPHGDRILDSTMRPLLDYDAAKSAQLVSTLRAYVAAGFSLTRSAKALQVHPNTVAYRLRRIREVCGRDPLEADDLLLLFLGLKLSGLSVPATPSA